MRANVGVSPIRALPDQQDSSADHSIDDNHLPVVGAPNGVGHRVVDPRDGHARATSDSTAAMCMMPPIERMPPSIEDHPTIQALSPMSAVLDGGGAGHWTNGFQMGLARPATNRNEEEQQR